MRRPSRRPTGKHRREAIGFSALRRRALRYSSVMQARLTWPPGLFLQPK